jgi:hypothetical protein
MNTASMLACLVIAVIIPANLIVTRVIARSEAYELCQKNYQYCLIWLLPFVGTAVAYAFSREPGTNGGRTYPADLALGEDPNVGISNAANDYFDPGHH